RLKYDPALRCRTAKDFKIRFFAWRLDAGAIAHSSQKSFIDQIFLVEIRRKDDQLFKRNFDFLTTAQSQKIDPAFQRQIPAVQQLLWRHSLTPEIVDNQRSAICLQLKRGFVKPGGFRPGEVSVLQRQLTANYYHRSLDAYPAPVVLDRIVIVGNRMVSAPIKDSNDAAVDFNRVGNPNISRDC